MSAEGKTSESTSAAAVAAWFVQRLPAEWTTTAPSVTVDREEITVVLALDGPSPVAPAATEPPGAAEEGSGEERAEPTGSSEQREARAGFVARFRDDSRKQRMRIAREAEHRFHRKVAWGVEVDGERDLFSHLAVPVMTRLRQPERIVLDTLVDAGVARSRSHALAWCVELVGRNTESWLGDLRSAMEHVERVRAQGPTG